MRLRILASFSMALGIFAGTIGFAGPTTAAPAAWVMPNVRNMVLQQAVKAIREVTGPAELDLRVLDKRNGQQVMNQTNWEVCAQGPSAGNEISQKSRRIVLYVKRFNQKTCS